MIAEQVKAVMPQVWPGVRDGIARWIRTAGGKRPSNLNHRIAEQVLWELARLDLLVTPEKRAVLDAAEKWHEGWGEDPISVEEDDVTEEDVLLYYAIGQLDCRQEAAS